MAQDDDPAMAFDAFRDDVLSPERIAELATDAKVDAEWLDSTLTVSLAESDYTMRWLAPWLVDRPRILEVGAGLGLASAYLASTGFEICSREPGVWASNATSGSTRSCERRWGSPIRISRSRSRT
jgi:hypothetical protein